MLSLTTLEAGFFRSLNALVEPAVRAGCGSPGIAPSGLIVLETKGRRTGRAHRVPVLATLIEDHVLVSSLRGSRSQWLQNLRANPAARYWLGGEAREAEALVLAPNETRPQAEELPPFLCWIAANPLPIASGFGWSFAVLTPRR